MTKDQKLTPRQRHALISPIFDRRPVDPGYHRVQHPFQTILTFDLHVTPEDLALAGYDGEKGKIGMWHGRVTSFPQQPLELWKERDRARARLMVKNLVRGVGRDDTERVQETEIGYRAFKWATVAEVAMAVRAEEKLRMQALETARDELRKRGGRTGATKPDLPTGTRDPAKEP